MRFLLFVLTFVASTIACLFAPSWAAAAQPVSGVIVKSGADVFLQSNDLCPHYRIQAQSADVTATLTKLSQGDFVTATGLFDTTNCIASIDSIDYVGLRRLLGNWMSKEGLISFHDFNTMSFYPLSGTAIKCADGISTTSAPDLLGAYSIVKPVLYKYSVTPSDGNEWIVFLSDAESTTFATIQISKDIAIMKIYDSDNGNIKRTLFLSRRGLWN